MDMQQESNEEALEAIVSTTKITDVNIDCLEHIFKDFKFNDLLNVANSNQHLQLAARRVFATKYGKTFVYIAFIKSFGLVLGTDDCMWANSTSALLNLLKCFGSCITKMNIYYEGIEWTNGTTLSRYMSKYCHANMTEINFHGGFVGEFFSIKKPFKNVQTVRFFSCKLGPNQFQLHELFPNVYFLKFEHSIITNTHCIKVHFPNLKNLSIDESVNGFNRTHVTEILALNPNLKNLRLQSLNINIFPDAGKYLQNVRNLELIYLHGSKISSNLSTICLKNVKRLELISSVGVFMNLPLKFGNIKEFIYTPLSKDVKRTLSNKEFFSQNPLKKVHFKSKIDIENGNDLAKALLPLVTELILDFRLSVAKAIDILNECQMLKFRFFLSNSNKYDKLRTQLGAEWSTTIEVKDTFCVVELQR